MFRRITFRNNLPIKYSKLGAFPIAELRRMRKNLGASMRVINMSEISAVVGARIVAYRTLGTGSFNVPSFRAIDGQTFTPALNDGAGNVLTGTMDGWTLWMPLNGKWEIKDNKGNVIQSWRDAVLPLDPVRVGGVGGGGFYGIGGGTDIGGDPSDSDQETQTT
jgi:hypothetical protein